MKKIKYLLLLVVAFFSFGFVVKANSLNYLKVNIDIDLNGTLHVTEVWDMATNKDTEIYKEEYNLGNIEITNFKVKDETRDYTLNNNWDIHDSFENKKYEYGINSVSEGIELCWGISEYGNKTYTISYDMTNVIFNTEDAQTLYLKVINDLDFPPERFEVIVSGPTDFEDSLDVWGYGYEGYAYVKDGKIYMSNRENTPLSKGNYGVLLVKFPLNTFITINSYEDYQKFDDVLDKAEEGTFEYDYNEGNKFVGIFTTTIARIITIIGIVAMIPLFKAFLKMIDKYKFGPAGKKINMKEINCFRDIPCDKNIFKANFIAIVYSLSKNKSDFMGTVLLKWLQEDKIKVIKTTKPKLFGDKEVTCIELKDGLDLGNDIENRLYNYMKEASEDNLLEENEFSKWAKKDYQKLYNWIDDVEGYGRDFYIAENLVTREKSKYLINDRLKEEAIKMAGLKKFFQEFTRMNEKTAIEVKLWNEYLMYAQIFGMADKVALQFKKLYPEILEQIESSNMNLDTIIILNHMSHTATVSASSARSAAESYSGGGGGFSSGGGGGGSFGGGGGGSR